MSIDFAKTAILLAITVTLTLSASSALHAQWRHESLFPQIESHTTSVIQPSSWTGGSPSAEPVLLFSSPRMDRPQSTVALATWGTLGMIAGFAGGALVGSTLGCSGGCFGEDPGLDQALIGAMAGSALATPLAVHLANGRRGLLAPAYVRTALIAGVGVVGLYAVGNPTDVIFLVGAPVAQVVNAVRVEHGTSSSGER